MPLKKQKSGYLFIIFLVLATALLSYLFLGTKKEISDETGKPTNLVINHLQNTNKNDSNIVEDEETRTSVFQNSTYGFKVGLSGNEEVRETTSEGIYTVHFNGDSVSVMDENMEGTIRESVGILSEKEVTVDGIKGTKIDGNSAKDGSAITLILVKKGGRIYYFQGSDLFLERMAKNFTFTNS